MPNSDLYPRFAETRLSEALADSPAVLIHGPCQCGKTTLAQSAGKRAGTKADFRGLRKLKEAAGKRFAGSGVLYDGETSAGFGDGMYAVPIRALWEPM